MRTSTICSYTEKLRWGTKQNNSMPSFGGTRKVKEVCFGNAERLKQGVQSHTAEHNLLQLGILFVCISTFPFVHRQY